MTLAIYLTAAALMLGIDALLCIAFKHKYNLPGSLIHALLWPITIALIVYAARRGLKVTIREG
jgi:hypothetical protein